MHVKIYLIKKGNVSVGFQNYTYSVNYYIWIKILKEKVFGLALTSNIPYTFCVRGCLQSFCHDMPAVQH
jgi:hypothetical protein